MPDEKGIISKSKMTAIKTAIQAKTGQSGSMTADQMAAAIAEISGGLGNAVETFLQVNQTAAAYLAASDYENDPNYTTQVITTYEDDSDTTLEKPAGKALTLNSAGTIYFIDETDGKGWSESVSAGSYTAYNLVPGHTHRWILKDASGAIVQGGRLRPTGALRMIYLQYPHNWRDLGGWACDGGTVRYGLLYRGAQLSYNNGVIASAADILRLRRLGIKYELDLRTLGQTAGQDGVVDTSDDIVSSVLGADVYYLKYPYSDANYVDIANLSGNYAAQTKALMRQIVDNVIHGEPTYTHCQAGADRTGVIAYLIEGVLGVSQADMDRDFELTSFYPTYERTRLNTNWRALVTYLNTISGSTLRDKFVQWYLDMGISMSEINAFRAALIDGTPEVLSEDDYDVSYSVTNTLPNGVTTSNDAVVADKGDPYQATITADTANNVAIKDITVKMGGVDITEDVVTLTQYTAEGVIGTVYSTGAIRIPSVTGDVVITATATQAAQTNQLPLAVDTDGSAYNGGAGYKAGYRLNSGGEEAAQSGAYVTGFIPCTKGQTITFENLELPAKNYTNYAWCYIAVYDSNKAKLFSNYSKDWYNIGTNAATKDANDHMLTITMNEATSHGDLSNMAYFRISALAMDSTSAIYIE